MLTKEKLLVSACLLGENVKYNGKNNKINFEILTKKYELIPFCSEVEGGLNIPRPPSEIVSFSPLKIVNDKNIDVTKEFSKGADKALEICKKMGIRKALLKERSPSCGKYEVYDGSFHKKTVKKSGITAKKLLEAKIEIFNELEINLLTQ